MVTRGFKGRRSGDASRVPPGQSVVEGFPVLSIGPAPKLDLTAWRFFLKDGRKAYTLRSDGVYRRVDKKIDAFSSQAEFCRLAHKAAQKTWTLEQRLQPMQRKDT